MIETYLKKRTNLLTTFILLDPRLDPLEIDIEFIAWMGTEGIPFSLVFTKTDKISKGQLITIRKKWEKTLEATWSELPIFFSTSAQARTGRTELLDYIESLLNKEN